MWRRVRQEIALFSSQWSCYYNASRAPEETLNLSRKYGKNKFLLHSVKSTNIFYIPFKHIACSSLAVSRAIHTKIKYIPRVGISIKRVSFHANVIYLYLCASFITFTPPPDWTGTTAADRE